MATSPRYHPQPPRAQQIPSTTPSQPPAMTPFLSPRRASPQRRSIGQSTPSPSYFGFQVDGSSLLSDSPQHAKSNWSPPSSTVRSTAAMSPSVVPLDQQPEFEAFRRQSEGKSFSLGGLNNFKMSPPSARPKQGRTGSSQSASQQSSKQQTQPRDIPAPSHRAALHPSTAELSRSPKRVLSPGSTTEAKRKGSPPFELNSAEARERKAEYDSQPRFKLPLDALNGSYNAQKARAETLPATSDTTDSQVFATAQHIMTLMNSKADDILLLDLRVSTQYAMSHVSGALNLCIPTTLLKRPSFNVQKLADTFKDNEQRRRFERWQNSSYIIVYDSSSAVLKDATICLNTIKKFRTEGYEGSLYIVRGGFTEFAKRFPKYIEDDVDAHSTAGVEGDGPEVAPVVGGCPMPGTDKPANPFFGNIRQNMDLIGGVGQMALKHPSKETSSAKNEYPPWLKDVANERDQGKQVSKKFEVIERREKKRMEEALSGKVSWGTTPKTPFVKEKVQIAGLEKGNKNRYNNIWPFEHSRVKLQGVPSHGCDYFNASHIKATWSNKRYISTQAPIPATFNDFWNVVWQQDVRVIVMLTAEKEGAQVKAHNYWDQKRYGPLHIDFLSEKRASLEPDRIHKHQRRPSAMKRHSTQSKNPQVPLAPVDSMEEKSGDQPYVTVRKFTVSHDKFPFEPMREITQLQYSSWPDFGAPAHPAHLLGLVEQCDAVVRTMSRKQTFEPEPPSIRPVLVHCSAGCGRTGTFCTVDSVIDMLKRQRISRDKRDTSPMDLDKKTPPRTVKESGGDFFAPQFCGDGEAVDGDWVLRDDHDLVEKTVEDFRHQRLSMVQSLRQYVLCYEIVMEWLVEQRLEGKEKSG
ncbi:hypothetical protein DOTSEDRAFT_73901 [Dothistroma septosporum NZE10]|uniref:protein-tyrosine-phosphatase n=1 Tax=Dothistroma septosporum (strain NZE10 / CBS 128990) TaxID=675120 RepID=N1PHR3_DOTSN|nr:hypothetical protein DOTSEDRAFT_73901 [Dothistroma septosporum NZE10]